MAQEQDLTIWEDSTGGQVAWNTQHDDFLTVIGFSNQPYLAMFGTRNWNLDPVASWWGNQFLEADTFEQFNSKTEQALRENSIDAGGVQRINNAVEEDLSYFANFGEIKNEITVESKDRIKIEGEIVVNRDSELYRPIVISDLLTQRTTTIII